MRFNPEIQRWTEVFRALGARNPEEWATSHVEEGINQYARFVFLREAWRQVIADGDTSWIDVQIQAAAERPRAPGSGAGPALQRLLAIGAAPEDLAEVVRVMQWETLFGMVEALDDSDMADYPSEELPRVSWALFAVDDEGQPLEPIEGLHESVLDTDPSGREMRPRSR